MLRNFLCDGKVKSSKITDCLATRRTLGLRVAAFVVHVQLLDGSAHVTTLNLCFGRRRVTVFGPKVSRTFISCGVCSLRSIGTIFLHRDVPSLTALTSLNSSFQSACARMLTANRNVNNPPEKPAGWLVSNFGSVNNLPHHAPLRLY